MISHLEPKGDLPCSASTATLAITADGISRRSFVQAGFLGGALKLPQLLAHRAIASTQAKKTSVIFIELADGPTQFETYDPKHQPENVMAMVYRHLGIDPEMTVLNFSGRPRYLLEERKVITEIT